MALYLLHISPPYKHAAHYLGYAENVAQRVAAHQRGEGARLTQVAVRAGCTLILVRTWPDGDRTLERQFKRWKNSPKLCPICNGQEKGIDCDIHAAKY